MVDASSKEYLEKSRNELEKLIEEPNLSDVPILVFGNKIDKKDALNDEELKKALNLKEEIKDSKGKVRVEVFMCSLAMNAGILDGFKWLNDKL